jgi:hypothetical protein
MRSVQVTGIIRQSLHGGAYDCLIGMIVGKRRMSRRKKQATFVQS